MRRNKRRILALMDLWARRTMWIEYHYEYVKDEVAKNGEKLCEVE